MNHHLKKNCEGVDASVFSGDVLYDDDSRAELKDYIGRWTRAIAEHERAAVEAALLAPQQAEPTCYKHDEPRKGCTWCDKQSPSAPTAVEPTAEQSSVVEPDERADFEAWINRGERSPLTVKDDRGGYLDTPTHFRWTGWQARASKGTK